MATKKTATKKATGTEAAAQVPAEKKTAVKKTATKKIADVKASAPEQTPKAAEKTSKSHPSHHDIALHAYLLWERDGKQHGHHDRYWSQAEQELKG